MNSFLVALQSESQDYGIISIILSVYENDYIFMYTKSIKMYKQTCFIKFKMASSYICYICLSAVCMFRTHKLHTHSNFILPNYANYKNYM